MCAYKSCFSASRNPPPKCHIWNFPLEYLFIQRCAPRATLVIRRSWVQQRCDCRAARVAAVTGSQWDDSPERRSLTDKKRVDRHHYFSLCLALFSHCEYFLPSQRRIVPHAAGRPSVCWPPSCTMGFFHVFWMERQGQRTWKQSITQW